MKRDVKNSGGRRGSVLLITVVLLLILAIMGTSYLFTSRIDRITSSGDVANNQIDALVDGTRDLALSYVANSLFTYDKVMGNQFREMSTPNTLVPYQNFDIPMYTAPQFTAGTGDAWLADRIPDAGGAWHAITAPMNATGMFEDPTKSGAAAQWSPISPTYNLPLIPGFTATAPYYPTLKSSGAGPYVAADADGDGIADAGLIRLPGVFSDGLTYYAGIRILDNNSALNVNTAWDNQFDYDASGMSYPTPFTTPSQLPVFPSFFPSAVGLRELFNNFPTSPTTTAQQDPFLSTLTTFRFGTGSLSVYNDRNSPVNTPLADVQFVSLGDAMYHQLSRRLSNPGFNAGSIRYQAFGDADAAALAYHFGLINPSAYPSLSLTTIPMTPIEQVLNSVSAPVFSIFSKAPNFPGSGRPGYGKAWRSYPTIGLADWVKDITLRTDLLHPYPNYRPYLVTRNGVSIQAQPYTLSPPTALNSAIPVPSVPQGMLPYGDRGQWQPNVIYYTNDVVTYAQTPTSNSDGNFERNEMLSEIFTFVGTAAVTNSVVGTPPVDPASGALNVGWALGGTAVPANLPRVPTLVKASVNTALFPELMRAFWNVMYPGAIPSTGSPQPMFSRFPMRDPGYLAQLGTAAQMQVLRSAIAAVNVENMRSPEPTNNLRTVLARSVSLNNGAAPYAIVYGCQPQPFITEVYVQTDTVTVPSGQTTANTNGGYMAVELYNPNPFPISLLSSPAPASQNSSGYLAGHTADYGWALATIDRSAAGTSKVLTLLDGFSVGSLTAAGKYNQGEPVVPAQGYLLLENYNPYGSTDASYRPKSSGLVMTGAITDTNPDMAGGSARTGGVPQLNTLFVPNLAKLAIGKELVLIRRRHADGSPSVGFDGVYSWDDRLTNVDGAGKVIYNDWVPVDSFDLTHMSSGGPKFAQALHYARPGGLTTPWQCVYPGTTKVPLAAAYSGAGPTDFQPAAQSKQWDPSIPQSDPWEATPPSPGMTLGETGNSSTAVTNESTGSPGYNPFSIQLNNENWPGLNKPTAGGPNYYPFGGFARNGDMMQIPFIGAYEICDNVNTGARTVYEMNSVSVDSSFADDQIAGDDSVEQVGRFVPTDNTQFIKPILQDTANAYGWTRGLFDYLTVQSPRDDYLPNVDPNAYPAARVFTKGPPYIPQYPTPVANSDASLSPAANGTQIGAANTDAENTEGVQGLVNINTASVQVLATLPLAVDSNGVVDTTLDAGTPPTPKNLAIAQAIVADRQKNGPFFSIYDLNRVKDLSGATFIFQTGDGDIAGFGGSVVSAKQGNISPGSGIPNQFDETYAQVTRLSNLITTRSDTFTVYIVVEGWQNAGTAQASLVTTRRAAFIVDRNTVTPVSRSVRTVNVPNN